MGCSKQTIANTIIKDLGYSLYKKRHRMILTEGPGSPPPLPLEPGLVAPSSPDCNPLDYSSGAWSRTRPTSTLTTLSTPQGAIGEEFTNVKKGVVAKACGRFRHRLEMVVAADRGYIEK
ncbi:Transposable element tcb1 transposase [Caligus rogercresseyi]|uniref:Transposable element tcb1 transposase n=1 Tax=Caligus rogercresseyi TaxID=217165 RepID=A0A7T8GVQ5_CALRO|nr:Transposable element tcb1 transposase [Caligus rogercresseyi]